jgi:hypothetical protein
MSDDWLNSPEHQQHLALLEYYRAETERRIRALQDEEAGLARVDPEDAHDDLGEEES